MLPCRADGVADHRRGASRRWARRRPLAGGAGVRDRVSRGSLLRSGSVGPLASGKSRWVGPGRSGWVLERRDTPETPGPLERRGCSAVAAEARRLGERVAAPGAAARAHLASNHSTASVAPCDPSVVLSVTMRGPPESGCMRVWFLSSGSSGNVAIVESNGARLLVDAGLGPKVCATRMRQLGADLFPRGVTAIVVTHHHGDHIAHLEPLARALRVPVYLHAGISASRVRARYDVRPYRPERRLRRSVRSWSAPSRSRTTRRRRWRCRSRPAGGLLLRHRHRSRGTLDRIAALDLLGDCDRGPHRVQLLHRAARGGSIRAAPQDPRRGATWATSRTSRRPASSACLRRHAPRARLARAPLARQQHAVPRARVRACAGEGDRDRRPRARRPTAPRGPARTERDEPALASDSRELEGAVPGEG